MNNTIIKRIMAVALLSVVFAGAVSMNTVEAWNSDYDRCENVKVIVDESSMKVSEGEYFIYQIETKDGQAEDYSVKYLPKGLTLNESTGLITGKINERGTYRLELKAENNCSEDTGIFRIIVISARTTGSIGRGDHNVTLDSTFIKNNEAGYVYLTDIPYTGAGDVLELSLIGLALVLWGSALGFALLKPEKREAFKNAFLRQSSPVAESAGEAVDELPLFQVVLEETPEELDTEELQILRSSANEEKVLFSEDALKAVVMKSQALGGPSLQLLSTVIEGAKATYPREDGYLRINNERIAEILA